MRIKRIEASAAGLDTYQEKLLHQDEAGFINVGSFVGSVNNFATRGRSQSTRSRERWQLSWFSLDSKKIKMPEADGRTIKSHFALLQ